MKLFAQVVRTAVNLVALPLEVCQDVIDSATGSPHREHTKNRIKMLVKGAEEDQ